MDIMDFAKKGDLLELENILKSICIDEINEKESGLWISSLTLAVLAVQVGSVELLLKYGADPDSVDKKGKTPLFYVGEKQPVKHDSIEKRIEIAQLLLNYKADVNICDDINNQALFYAVKGSDENFPLVELLLKYGADPNHKNRAGNSPLDLARKIDDKKMIELLEKGSKINR